MEVGVCSGARTGTVPHVRFVLESDVVDKDWEPRMNLLWRYGLCLHEDGRWGEAEKLYVQVIEIQKEKLGADHPDTLASMANLAVTYSEQGRQDEAKKLMSQVIDIQKDKLRADHPDTLTSIANLAFMWKGQGQDMEAISLITECVQRQKRALRVNHPNSISSSMALAKWKARK
jgi:Flp pilus assembly protein TadD